MEFVYYLTHIYARRRGVRLHYTLTLITSKDCMTYFRVQWQDADDTVHLSDPLPTWIAAANYRAELIISGAVRAPVYASIIDYQPRAYRLSPDQGSVAERFDDIGESAEETDDEPCPYHARDCA